MHHLKKFNVYEIINDIVKIHGSRNQIYLIDLEDLDKIKKYNWHSDWNIHTQTFYASSHLPTKNKKQIAIRLHNIIMNHIPNRNIVVDHINGDTVDNRKNNLQIIPHWLNKLKSKKQSSYYGAKTKSIYPGVSYNKKIKDNGYFKEYWVARIQIQNKHITLGHFSYTPEGEAEAAQIYMKKRNQILNEYRVKYIA